MDLQGKVCRVSPQELVSFIYAYVPACLASSRHLGAKRLTEASQLEF